MKDCNQVSQDSSAGKSSSRMFAQVTDCSSDTPPIIQPLVPSASHVLGKSISTLTDASRRSDIRVSEQLVMASSTYVIQQNLNKYVIKYYII